MPDARGAWARIGLWTALVAALLAAGCGSPRPATPAYALPEPPPGRRAPAEARTPIAPATVGPLTLDAAVARAVERSGEVAALRWSAYAARQATYANVQYRDPQVRAQYGEDELSERGRQIDTDPLVSPSDVSRTQEGSAFGVGLRFYPRNPLVTYWMKQEGHTAARAAEELVREAQWRIASEVRRLFVYVQFLEQDYALLERHQATCRDLVAQARTRHALGEMVGQEVYRLLRRCVETDGDASRLRQELNQSRRMLAARVDVPPADLDLVSTDPDLAAHLTGRDDDELLAAALRNRPDLAVLVYTTDAARHALGAARSQRVPWIEHIQGAYGESDADELSTSRDLLGDGSDTRSNIDGEEWRVDAAITLPLFSWASRRPRQAKALLEAALQYEANLRGAIETEVRTSVEDARFLEAEAAARMEEGEAMLREARELAGILEQGVAGMPDELLQLQEDILRIERVHLRHRYDTQAARIRLMEVLGVVNGDEVGE